MLVKVRPKMMKREEEDEEMKRRVFKIERKKMADIARRWKKKQGF